MTGRWVVLVARPTPSGVDRRSVDAIAADVSAAVPDPVRVAFLDQAEPSIPAVLDDAVTAGVGEVLVVPLAVPADAYLSTWLARAVANWRETRATARLEVRLAGSPDVGAAVAAVVAAGGKPITASPAAFRSPAWSELPGNERHLLVCRGPRCTSHGAGATHRALSNAVRGTETLVTPIGCLGPCNLGPLVIEYPTGTWHRRVDEERAMDLGRG